MAVNNIYQILEENLRDNLNNYIMEDDKRFSMKDLFNRVEEKYKAISRNQINQLVIVYMESTVDCLATILALWKAGKTYVPINKFTPKKRIDLIKSTLESFSEINIDNDGSLDIILNEFNPKCSNDNLAYIIFTSGTTGQPKGVKITHENLISLFSELGKLFVFSESDTWINLHSLEFDFSVWEIFGPLFYKNNLILLGRNARIYEFDKIAELIDREHVTILNQTPTAFFSLMDYLGEKTVSALKAVIFGGEILDYGELQRYYQEYNPKGVEFYNLYGITEITIHATFHKVVKADFNTNFSNIGKGIFGDNVFLEKISNSDSYEIVVSGPTVSVGYINNIAENNKRFRVGAEGRLYYSGDLGEYFPNGDIHYIGRIDDQIELNGFRVELDDVKANISAIDKRIRHIEIIKYKNRLLCFYTRMMNGVNIDIKKKLQDRLPKFMIPTKFIMLDNMPLTVNGKVDKKQLQKIYDNTTVRNEVINKDSYTEFELWLLREYRLEDIDFSNTSFTELGLSSVELIDLHKKITDRFKLKKEVNVIDLFQFKSIMLFEDVYFA